ALPIIIRHKLQAIAFYGPHDGGVDFDPDEIRSINGLLVPARAAYDHLEAEVLRMEAEELRREGERSRLEAQRLAGDRWVDVADESAEPEINPS
ncbi:MAG: hypothetical protein M3Z41_07120, partial [Candidatus Eremiobacteraeota bacterium]|nr:hypothetical protein [Candidatus Eremiobacteraeota bacterium]